MLSLLFYTAPWIVMWGLNNITFLLISIHQSLSKSKIVSTKLTKELQDGYQCYRYIKKWVFNKTEEENLERRMHIVIYGKKQNREKNMKRTNVVKTQRI